MEGDHPDAYQRGHPVYVAQLELGRINREMVAGEITPEEARQQQLALRERLAPEVRAACGFAPSLEDGLPDDAPDMEPHPHAWLGTSLIHEALAEINEAPDGMAPPPGYGVADDLTEEQRILLEVLDVGASYAEAAVHLGVTRSAVANMVARIKITLGVEDLEDVRAAWRVIRADEEQARYDAEQEREWGA
jgi:hypothetical protein